MEEQTTPQSQEKVIKDYMTYCLEHAKRPESVYLFAKKHDMEEKDFYVFFSSFEALEKVIFGDFFSRTMELLHKSEEYEHYDARTKLLSFYFTYFEILTANRTFAMFLLQESRNPLKNLAKLGTLRTQFLVFIQNLDIKKMKIEQEFIQKVQDKGINEMAWGQFLMTLKFWMDDESKAFEKTDIYIEKSIHASFDLMDIKPFESIIDFGKFIFKEKFSTKA